MHSLECLRFTFFTKRTRNCNLQLFVYFTELLKMAVALQLKSFIFSKNKAPHIVITVFRSFVQLFVVFAKSAFFCKFFSFSQFFTKFFRFRPHVLKFVKSYGIEILLDLSYIVTNLKTFGLKRKKIGKNLEKLKNLQKNSLLAKTTKY